MLPVCGRNFKLETIPADKVEMATMVWLGNERDQDLLNETFDLVPSFLTSGQLNPAFARKTAGIIPDAEVLGAENSHHYRAIIAYSR